MNFMESFKHVSNTWLVAQLLYPFIFYGLIMIVGWEWADLSYAPLLVVCSFLFSLGGYVLCIFSFNVLWRIKLPIRQKFFLWMITMMVCILVGVYFVGLLFFEAGIFVEMLILVVPGLVAAILAACIRFKQFVSTVNYLNEEP
jgi:hypothetical protein